MNRTKKETLFESVSKKGAFKRKFSLGELYRSFVFLPRAIVKLAGNKKTKLVDDKFIERIHLAVTEVNGCAVCSYKHTQMALEQGMSNEEISSFLSGEEDFIKPEEAKGIFFAQHYADARGFPKVAAYDTLVKEYGEEEAAIILSAIQVITVGNSYGIPFSAFLSRLKGKPYRDSTLWYELEMLFVGLLCLPIALIHGAFRGLLGLPNKRLDKGSSV